MDFRIIVGLGVVSIACIIFGAQKLSTASSNTKQLEISYTEFCQSRPSAAWVKVKNCRLALPASVVRESTKRGRVTGRELFIPVIDGDPKSKNKMVCLVVATRAKRYFQALDRLERMSEQQALETVLSNPKEYFPSVTLSGLIRVGMFDDSALKSKIRNLSQGMPSDLAIIDLGARPSAGEGLFLLAIGVLILVGGGVYFFGFSSSSSSSRSRRRRGRDSKGGGRSGRGAERRRGSSKGSRGKLGRRRGEESDEVDVEEAEELMQFAESETAKATNSDSDDSGEASPKRSRLGRSKSRAAKSRTVGDRGEGRALGKRRTSRLGGKASRTGDLKRRRRGGR